MNELLVNSCGVLPSGPRAWKWIDRDCYAGTREALVHAGIAQADWFPGGTTAQWRAFTVAAASGCITLVPRTSTEWEIDIPVSAAERERREQECERQRTARRAAQAREEGQFELEDAKLRRSIALAPAVEPGSLSESELRHLRLLRTVGRRTRDSILDFTERLLLADARYGELAQRQPPRLVLAVDNTRAGQ